MVEIWLFSLWIVRHRWGNRGLSPRKWLIFSTLHMHSTFCKSVLAVRHFLGFSSFSFLNYCCSFRLKASKCDHKHTSWRKFNTRNVIKLYQYLSVNDFCIYIIDWKTCKLPRFATSSTKETPDRKGSSAIFWTDHRSHHRLWGEWSRSSRPQAWEHLTW